MKEALKKLREAMYELDCYKTDVGTKAHIGYYLVDEALKVLEQEQFVFPGEKNDRKSGLTLRQYAAIRLKVPNSGEEWLDDMIQESRRLDYAGRALTGLAGTINWYEPKDWEHGATVADGLACAMLAREEKQE
jgi:hypothetical protein